ncbi:MAG: tRNA adenosine(34) deaminase TadA [Chlamydiales bacterium]|nr:tRNA adenosine(34) deaminase TadA [Chlamydiales bacterium]
MLVSKEEDEHFMKYALQEARRAFKEDEVPIGAVLVQDGKIIARGHNQVELLKDATAHAEMVCITAGASFLENWRLLNTTLYCTLEPCSMCAGALLLSRVKRLVWGAPDIRQGACGSWVNLFDKNHPCHKIEVQQGILQAECADLMRQFFQKQRKSP